MNVVISVPGASATTGIVWTLDTIASGTATPAPVQPGRRFQRAYDATSLSTTLWLRSSSTSDKCGNAVKFVVPTVADGRPYVVGTNQLTVYGLLP